MVSRVWKSRQRYFFKPLSKQERLKLSVVPLDSATANDCSEIYGGWYIHPEFLAHKNPKTHRGVIQASNRVHTT